MKLNYTMALEKKSYSVRHTPASKDSFLNFYMECVGHYYAQEGYYTEREGLDTYLLFYTVSGCGWLKYDNREHLLEKGTLAVIQCSEYQYYCTQGSEWEFYFIHFYGKSADHYYQLRKGLGAFIVTPYQPLKMEELFRELELRGAESGMISDIRIACIMENLFAEIMEAHFSPKQDHVSVIHEEAIMKLQRYLKEHCQKLISVDQMAEMCSISKYHFLRVFKQITGMTPYEYLKYCRINESKRLLTETDYPVSQIADLVGYVDVNRYIQNFKQCVGMTPLKYRKHSV